MLHWTKKQISHLIQKIYGSQTLFARAHVVYQCISVLQVVNKNYVYDKPYFQNSAIHDAKNLKEELNKFSKDIVKTENQESDPSIQARESFVENDVASICENTFSDIPPNIPFSMVTKQVNNSKSYESSAIHAVAELFPMNRKTKISNMSTSTGNP